MIGSIRRLTAAELAAREELEATRYEEIAAELEAEERKEYEAEFGDEFTTMHPYSARGLHQRVMQRLSEEAANYNESRADNEH